jgi:hypothetical protein
MLKIVNGISIHLQKLPPVNVAMELPEFRATISKTSAPLNAPFSYDFFEPLCGKESTLLDLCCANSNSAMLIFCIVPSAKQT